MEKIKQKSLPDQWQDPGTCHLSGWQLEAIVLSSWLKMARAGLANCPSAPSGPRRPCQPSSLLPPRAALLPPSVHHQAAFPGG